MNQKKIKLVKKTVLIIRISKKNGLKKKIKKTQKKQIYPFCVWDKKCPQALQRCCFQVIIQSIYFSLSSSRFLLKVLRSQHGLPVEPICGQKKSHSSAIGFKLCIINGYRSRSGAACSYFDWPAADLHLLRRRQRKPIRVIVSNASTARCIG